MLSPRGSLGQARPFTALSLPPQTPSAGTRAASLRPLCPSRPAASFCTEQFLKWKLRHNIHWTGTHTHVHRRLLQTGRTSAALKRAPRNAYGAPPGEEGRAYAPPWSPVRSSFPPFAPLAARGRGGGGTLTAVEGYEEGSAILVRGPGAREAALGARRERTEVDSWPQEPEG